MNKYLFLISLLLKLCFSDHSYFCIFCGNEYLFQNWFLISDHSDRRIDSLIIIDHLIKYLKTTSFDPHDQSWKLYYFRVLWYP